MALAASTLAFLSDLEDNNNRPWFEANKDRFLAAQQDVRNFAADFFAAYAKVEEIPPQDPAKSLFRIYRDVRFSKNKDPYKAWLSLELKRQPGCMGLYVHFQPGNKSIAATGLWEPSPQQLAAARQEIDYNAVALRKLLAGKKLAALWGDMAGDKLKTAPRGYDKEDPNVDLLRYKQFMLVRYLQDEELTRPDLVKNIAQGFVLARPFMDFFDAPMRELLSGEK
jgi:uncharacterized protein (TIGR02453 family)